MSNLQNRLKRLENGASIKDVIIFKTVFETHSETDVLYTGLLLTPDFRVGLSRQDGEEMDAFLSRILTEIDMHSGDYVLPARQAAIQAFSTEKGQSLCPRASSDPSA